MSLTAGLDKQVNLFAEHDDKNPPLISVDRLLEIDRRCVDFERRLLRGERPELSEFTRGLSEAERRFLIEELQNAEHELSPAANADGSLLIKIGCTLGRYRLLRLIGRGGMGQVFAARDLLLQREVAIKVMRADLLSEDHIRRFDREARTVAALNHPNILSLYDYGTHQGQPYVVTELLGGKSLADRLGQGSFLTREALLVMKQVVAGLQIAHAMGIVHRDLKPANIAWMRTGLIKVLDFGLVGYHDQPLSANSASSQHELAPDKITDGGPIPVDESVTMTKPGMMVGTIGYVAPEQLRGERVGPTADVFSCGCILYEMLVGECPFRRPSVAATIAATLQEPYDKEKLVSVGCCKPIIQFIDGCLQKDPKDRFQSAATLNLAIDTLLDSTREETLNQNPQTQANVNALLGSGQAANTLFEHEKRYRGTVVTGLGILTALLIVGNYNWRDDNPEQNLASSQPTTVANQSQTADEFAPVEDGMPMIVLMPPQPSLVILPFEVFSTDETLELTGMTLPMEMVRQLSQQELLSVAPFSSGQRLANSQMETAYTIGYKLRVRCVVTGSILLQGERLIVNCEIVSSKLRTVVHTVQQDGRIDELPQLAEKLNAELVKFVGTYQDPR